jgi:hypothetical protein
MLPLGVVNQQTLGLRILPIFYDRFIGPNGLLGSHTPDIDEPGNGWVDDVASIDILDNRAVEQTTGSTWAFSSVELNVSDCVITAFPQYLNTPSVRPSYCAINFRVQDSNNFLTLTIVSSTANPLEFGLYKCVAGSFTKLGSGFGVSGGIPFRFNDRVKITLNGTSMQVEMESEGVDFTVVDSTFLTETKHGIRLLRWDSGVENAECYEFKVESLEAAAQASRITYVGSDMVTAASSGSSVSINAIGSVVEGDTLLLFVQTRNSLIGSVSGFTEVQDYGVLINSIATPPGAENERFKVFKKTATGSEPASYTVNLTDEGTDGQVVGLIAFRGVTTVTAGGNTTGFECTGPTAAIEDVVVGFQGTSFGSAAFTGVRSAFIEAQQEHNGSVSVGASLAYKEIEIDGAIGDIRWDDVWEDYSMCMYVHLQ